MFIYDIFCYRSVNSKLADSFELTTKICSDSVERYKEASNHYPLNHVRLKQHHQPHPLHWHNCGDENQQL